MAVALWLACGFALIAAFIALDGWMDRRPGGRKSDEALRYLAAQERYRAALARQYETRTRYGSAETRENK